MLYLTHLVDRSGFQQEVDTNRGGDLQLYASSRAISTRSQLRAASPELYEYRCTKN